MVNYTDTAVFYDQDGNIVMIVNTDKPAQFDTDPEFNRAELVRVRMTYAKLQQVPRDRGGVNFAQRELMAATHAAVKAINPLVAEKIQLKVLAMDALAAASDAIVIPEGEVPDVNYDLVSGG